MPDAHHRRCAPRSGRSLGSRTAAYAALSLQRARVGRRRSAKVFSAWHAFGFADVLGALSGTERWSDGASALCASLDKKNTRRSQSGHLRSCLTPIIRTVRPAPVTDSPAFQPLHSISLQLRRLRFRSIAFRSLQTGETVKADIGRTQKDGRCGTHPRRFAPRAARTFVTLRFSLIALGRRDKSE